MLVKLKEIIILKKIIAKSYKNCTTGKDVPDRTFAIRIGKTAEFKFFKSNCRRDDNFGEIFEDMDESFEDTSSLKLELEAYEGMKPGDIVDVKLQVAITEIGTLEVYCIELNGEHRWKLEFNVRESA